MAKGFYEQSIFDSNRLINEMLQQDAMDKQRHQWGWATTSNTMANNAMYMNGATPMLYMNGAPPMFVPPSLYRGLQYDIVHYDEAPLRHYCEDVPKRLESYYRQLLDYHYQKDPSLRRETEKICCALKRLKIKYY